MRKTKTGRLASKEERDYARAIVEMYRKAAKFRAENLRRDPDAELDEWDFDASNPEYALKALERFVEFGTFAPVDMERVEHLLLNLDFDELREAELTYEQAIFELAKRHHVGTRTIERWLAKPMRPLIPENSSFNR